VLDAADRPDERRELQTRRFRVSPPLSLEEKWGYLVWGPIALFIAVSEILAAVSRHLKNAIPWPTISTTVGHLEREHHWIAVVVVAVIAVVAYHALTCPMSHRTGGGRTRRTWSQP
jgi:hypothetical protein